MYFRASTFYVRQQFYPFNGVLQENISKESEVSQDLCLASRDRKRWQNLNRHLAQRLARITSHDTNKRFRSGPKYAR